MIHTLREDRIRSGELKVKARLVDASNATLLASIDDEIDVIYKPIAGERPLWDFPDGQLAFREVAAYEISKLAGINRVPYTVLRDGPFGLGAVQEWIEIDQTLDLIAYAQSDDSQLRELALFDAIINNTDRKIGHLLMDQSGFLWGCDHGVTFHVENKLRTVLWQWRGQALSHHELAQLEALLALDLKAVCDTLLTDEEIDALRMRITELKSKSVFPFPAEDWPAIPWPPV